MLSRLARLALPALIAGGLTLGGVSVARADHDRDFGYGGYGYGDHCDYHHHHHHGYYSYRAGPGVSLYIGVPSYRPYYSYGYSYREPYYWRPSYARRTYGYGIYYGWGF
jgi:hypothetical protein